MAMLFVLLNVLFLSCADSLAESCGDETSCVVIPTTDAIHASAMLQVKTGAEPLLLSSTNNKDGSEPVSFQTIQDSGSTMLANSGSLAETRACLPKGLQEMHLQGVRRHAAFLSSRAAKKRSQESA